MKVYESKEVMKTENILTKIICDECGKEIKGDYYEVTDWTDNMNEPMHMCSDECVLKKFADHIKEKHDTINLDIGFEKRRTD